MLLDQPLDTHLLEPNVELPPPSMLKRKIIIKNKVELELNYFIARVSNRVILIRRRSTIIITITIKSRQTTKVRFSFPPIDSQWGEWRIAKSCSVARKRPLYVPRRKQDKNVEFVVKAIRSRKLSIRLSFPVRSLVAVVEQKSSSSSCAYLHNLINQFSLVFSPRVSFFFPRYTLLHFMYRMLR